MKFCNEYFKQKNTKRGMALSTAMAIAIVLTIMVTLLVSMATLNITTTQATVSQREAYIQAKSAIAFAESYYNSNPEEIPKTPTSGGEGEALMVFSGYKIAEGASVYVTKDNSIAMSNDDIEALQESAPSTYLRVVNTSNFLDLIAYCKYGDGNMYTLTKEFDLTPDTTGRGNTFNGNIKYEVGSDTRYLRIHVKPSAEADYAPFLWTWANEVNEQNSTGTQYGTSAVVNHLTGSMESGKENISHNLSGEWLTSGGGVYGAGPQGAMTYEGNGWYVYEIAIPTTYNINTVNANIAKKGSLRSGGDHTQSWEIFGIPVPDKDETGPENGKDVYITLNQKDLQDAKRSGSNLIPGSSSDVDDLSRWYQNAGSATKFAQKSSQYFSVYTKHNEQIIHYRVAKVYDDSANPGGFEYEGYGWYRTTDNSTVGSITINGTEFSYGGEVLSYNSYNSNKEVIQEMFVVAKKDDGTGAITGMASFNTEAEANEWLADEGGDAKASDYVTVYAKGDLQPVDSKRATTIEYEYTEFTGGVTPPSPTKTLPDSSGYEVNETEISGEKTTPQSSSAALSVQPSGDGPSILQSGDRRIYYRATAGNEDGDPNKDWDTSAGYTVEYDGITTEMVNIPDTNINNAYRSDYFYADVPESVAAVVIHPTNGYDDHSIVIDLTDTITYCDGNTIVSSGTTVYFYNKSNLIGTPAINACDNSGNRFASETGDEGFSGDSYGTPMYKVEGTPSLWWADLPTSHITDIKVCDWGTGDNAVNAVSAFPFGDNCCLAVDGTWITLDDVISSSGYLIMGSFAESNYWSHQFGDAIPMLTLDGGLVYTYTFESLMPGEYDFKVISASSELTEPDAEGKTIDYTQSWGEGYGSGANSMKFKLDKKSKVVITFTVNEGEDTAKVTYQATDLDDLVVTWKNVAFYNGALKHNTDHDKDSQFHESGWSEVYVTYTMSDGSQQCKKIESADTIIWTQVPAQSEYIYFSNMPSNKLGEAGFERTENVLKNKYESVVNPVLFPITSKVESGVTTWTMGDNDDYRKYTGTIDTKTGSDDMVYAGTNQTAYYDIPIVDMLERLAGGGHYAFATRKWKNYEAKLPNGHIMGTYTFSGNCVVYQGETYYYEPTSSDSFLICNNNYSGRYGYLFKGQFAYSSADNTVWGLEYEQRRAGAAYTSDDRYGGYVPSWYTFKIPAVTEYSVKKISGITESGGTVDVNTGKLQVVKSQSSDNVHQPIYITYNNSKSSVGLYTYDVSNANVDTNEDGKVSVYFDNTEGWSSPCIYAVGSAGTKKTSLTLDATDSDTSYYKFTFNEGEYAYFIFYDGTDTTDVTALSDDKKSPVLYFTGEERNHEYKILARGRDSGMDYYLHPKTRALVAMNEALGAYNESFIYLSYKSDGTPNGGLSCMTRLEKQFNEAKNYYEYGSGGSWSASEAGKYEDLAAAARRLVSNIKQCRIYLSTSTEKFPEDLLRDDVVEYIDSWKTTLRAKYNQALAVYGDESKQVTDYMNAVSSSIEDTLNNPEITLSADAVQVIINDQDGWGKDNIKIWKKDSSVVGGWIDDTSKHICDTTQAGYYAFVFKIPSGTLSETYAITNGSIPTPPDPADPDSVGDPEQELSGGSRFFFNTKERKWEADTSTPTRTVSVDTIEQGGTFAHEAKKETPIADHEFILYFNNDTTVKYGSTTYKIWAGAYMINSTSYAAGWDSDIGGGKKGIDLFTDNAKAFFETPSRYGMSSAAGAFSDYNGMVGPTGGSGDLDMMCNKITGDVDATPGTGGTSINFRTDNASGKVFSLDKRLTLTAKKVKIASNYIDLSAGGSFIINSSSVDFLTNTTVKTTSGAEYKITHGTWVFTGSGATARIDLNNENWMTDYTLVDSSSSNLTGGTYVASY